MSGAHRDTGEFDRPYHPPADPKFKRARARGRAPVAPERPAPHLRAAHTGEIPLVTEVPVGPPEWALWLIVLCAACSFVVSTYTLSRLLQVEQTIKQPIVITTTAPTPSK
jgi:hypothetical protein